MSYNPTYTRIKEFYASKQEFAEDHQIGPTQYKQCNLCGMVFPALQRHGPVDVENTRPIGYGSTKDGAVCTECGRRTDEAITLVYRDIEEVAICPGCLKAHHGIEYHSIKYSLIRWYLNYKRILWHNKGY